MRLRAVVFDLDGTLVDSMGVMPHVYVDTIRALGGPAVSSGDVVAAWHVGPTSAVLEHFVGRPTVAAMMLEAAGLRTRSWAVVAGDDVSAPKPDPEGLRLACARLGVDPSSAAYVGDAAVDLWCAAAAGAVAIQARWGNTTGAEIPGPLAVSRPRELSELLERVA